MQKSSSDIIPSAGIISSIAKKPQLTIPDDSWFACAACSLDVYRDSDRQSLAPGWSLLLDCPAEYQTDGYFGAAYIAPIEDTTCYIVIIAHRGTHSWIDGIEDFLILLGKCPTTFFNNALPFTQYVQNYINQKFPQGTCWIFQHAGHSLGAILAELMPAYYANQPLQAITLTSTFDSPGSKPIIQNLINSGQFPANALNAAEPRIASCFADIDAINTCNAQTDPYAFPNHYISPYTYNQDGGVPAAPEILYYFLGFTVENQHKMLNFYNYWKDTTTVPPKPTLQKPQDFVWPVGFENGYDYYLTYDNHPNYWDGYMQSYWDNHPASHGQYDNDFNVFWKFFTSQYLNMQSKEEISPNAHPPTITWQNAEAMALAKADIHRQLYIAVMTNNLPLATQCLQQQANPNSTHGKKRFSLLHIAILCGNFAMLKLLLAHQAQVNYANSDGDTALHLAVKVRHTDVLKYAKVLIESFSDAMLKNHAGQTVVDILEATNAVAAEEFKSLLHQGFAFMNKEAQNFSQKIKEDI